MTNMILGLLWLVLITCIIFLMLNMSKSWVDKIVFVVAMLLIIIKTSEFSIYWISDDFTKMPVEYSQISYFLFGFTVIFKLKRLKPYAIFAAFFSGISYLLIFPFFTEYFFGTRGVPTTLLAVMNHSFLYMGGMLLMRDETYDRKYVKKIVIWSYIFVGYSLLMRFLLKIEDPTLFIYLMLDANFIKALNISAIFRYVLFVLYHIALCITFSLCVLLYHHIHLHIHKRYFSKSGVLKS